jgi:hypothetical protein
MLDLGQKYDPYIVLLLTAELTKQLRTYWGEKRIEENDNNESQPSSQYIKRS